MSFFDYVSDKKLVILIISIILNFLLCLVSCYFIWNNFNHKCEVTNTDAIFNNSEEEIVLNENFYVDVKGEVKNPGVYEVNNSNIINDVILLAGGFTKKAYTDNINLSKKVSNELVIYVYSENEYKKLNEDKETISIKECVCPSYEITDCTTSGNSEIITEDNGSENNQDNTLTDDDLEKDEKLININIATKEELMTLTGVGESKANAIIEYRNKNKFQKIEDIKNVNGIGDSMFEKIKNFITI